MNPHCVSIPSRSGYRQNKTNGRYYEVKSQSLQDQGTVKMLLRFLLRLPTVSIPSRSGYRQNEEERLEDESSLSQSLQDQGTVKMNSVSLMTSLLSQSLQDQGTVKIESMARAVTICLNPFKIRVPSK